MAYNREIFILKEGSIQYGTWTDPHTLTPATDPLTSFTATDNLGYLRQGSINIMLNDEFVEYLSGTPQKIIRKDLIRRNFQIECVANQFNSAAYDILYNCDVDTGAYDLAWIGNDTPVPTRRGWLFTGQKVNGNAIYVAIWAGEVVTEDKSMAFPGTDYVDMPVTIQAFEGDSFTGANANDEHNYGMIWEVGTS